MARYQRTPYVILGLLRLSADEPRSGYEIKKVIDSIISHFWSESHGQLYPVLKRLAKDGLIRAVAAKANVRKKVLYSITAKGKAHLRTWLEAPVEISKPRDELILKLFFGNHTDVTVLQHHLRANRNRAQAILGKCLQWREEATVQGGGKNPFLLITIRAGIERSKTDIRWSEDSLEVLSSLPHQRNHGRSSKASRAG